ncbi:MAG: metalloendopeptidase [Gracilibacter sp. BRH_c7a]|nr:MAG: metalloendopeptidase [Gracilibacter sp. BRH_c7a]
MIYREKLKDYLSLFQTQMKKITNSLKTKISSGAQGISWKSPKTVGLLVLMTIVVTSGVFYFSTTTSAVSIIVNGQEIGYASDMNQATDLVNEILEEQGEIAGTTALTSDTIEYNKVRIKKKENLAFISKDDLLGNITPYIEGYGLKINDKMVAVLANEDEVNKLLAKYKDHYTKPSEDNSVESVEIIEEIAAVPTEVHPTQVTSVDEALEMLLNGDITETEYIVQPNDSWWLIARNHNMLIEDVLAGNPGLTEDSIIKPDEVLKIVRSEPYLTVLSKGTKVVKEVIPFNVATQVDSSLAYGQRVVRQDGKDGEKIVTYNYVEQNGKTVEKEVVKEDIITEPVRQLVARGPNPPAAVTVGTSRGSGNVSGLTWPLSGQITSYYGYRWGSFHTGIDINGVTGQPEVAAQAGIVASAGWAGNYGYSVLIDHGNGVATRYAHASKLLVKAGDNVEKGQTISLVGSTGRSTGAHLHFEVLINGSHVNPLNYL